MTQAINKELVAADYRPRKAWPDPTPEMLETSMFEAIWQCIKSWDINVPDAYNGYCGATGNHVRAIMDAITQSQAVEGDVAFLLKQNKALKELKKADLARICELLDKVNALELQLSAKDALLREAKEALIAMCAIYDTDGDHSYRDGENAREKARKTLTKLQQAGY